MSSDEETFAALSARVQECPDDGAAQADLGELLMNGRGCGVDQVAGIECYRIAAELGNAKGMCSFGFMLVKGLVPGAAMSSVRGRALIERSAAMDYAFAHFVVRF
jgi:TPR repeat protein